MLAETQNLDGGVLAIALIVLLLVLCALSALMVLGFVLAPKAAASRGTGAAPVWWFVLFLEGLVAVTLFVAVGGGRLMAADLFWPAIIGGQVALFLWARRTRRTGRDGH